MADVVVPVNQLSDQGVAPVTQAMAVGDNYIVRNNGRVTLRIDNSAGAGAANITVVTPRKVGDLEVEERVVAVPSGELRYIAPLNPSTYNDPSGDLDISTDADAGGITLEATGI